MIYFLRCGEYVKIGYSENPWRRAHDLRIGNPYPVELLRVIDGDQSAERKLHKKFKKYHHRGEWFTESILKDTEYKKTLDESIHRTTIICRGCKGKITEKPYMRYYCARWCHENHITRMIKARFPHRPHYLD